MEEFEDEIGGEREGGIRFVALSEEMECIAKVTCCYCWHRVEHVRE